VKEIKTVSKQIEGPGFESQALAIRRAKISLPELIQEPSNENDAPSGQNDYQKILKDSGLLTDLEKVVNFFIVKC